MSINNLQSTTCSFYVIRGWVRIRHNEYAWRYASINDYDQSINWEETWEPYSIDESMSHDEREDVVLLIEDHLDWDPEQYCELIKVTETRTFDNERLDSDRITGIRRNRALAKLTQSEIKLLGLEKFAVYDKLKFHNATEVEEDGR